MLIRTYLWDDLLSAKVLLLCVGYKERRKI